MYIHMCPGRAPCEYARTNVLGCEYLVRVSAIAIAIASPTQSIWIDTVSIDDDIVSHGTVTSTVPTSQHAACSCEVGELSDRPGALRAVSETVAARTNK